MVWMNVRHGVHRWLVGVLFLATGAYAVAEDLGLMATYPSPRGVYQAVRVRGSDPLTSVPRLILSSPGNTPTAESVIQLYSLDANSNGINDAGDKLWQITARGNQYSVVNERNDLMFWKWNQTAWGAPMMIDFATENVGIGTTSPQHVLHLQRDVNGAARLRISNADPGANATAAVRFGSGTGPDLFTLGIDRDQAGAQPFLWTETATDLRIGVGSFGERIRVQAATGNVGIGEPAPDALLDVNGNAEFYNRIGVGGGFDPFTDLNSAGIWTSASPNDRSFFYGILDATPGAEKAGIFTKNVGWMTSYTTGGQVGLGTTAPTPGMRLDVQGNTYINGKLDVSGATALNNTLNVNGNLDASSEIVVSGKGTQTGTLCIGTSCRTQWQPVSTCGSEAFIFYMCDVMTHNSCVAAQGGDRCLAGWNGSSFHGGLGGGCSMVTCFQWCGEIVCVP